MKPPRPIRIKSPSARRGRKTARAPRRDLETPIHEAIFQFLTVALLPGSLIHHSPNELEITADPEVRRIVVAKAKRKGMRPGWPDLEAVAVQRDGSWRLFLIEVKSENGDLSPTQKDVRDAFRRLQIPYCIARSVRDVEDFLEWERIDTRLAA